MNTQKLTRATFNLYFDASKQFPVDLWLSLLNPVGTMLTNVAVPYFASRSLVDIVQHSSSFRHDMIGLIASAAIGVIANRIGFLRLMKLEADVSYLLQKQVFERLLARSVGFHSNNISGKLISDTIDYVAAYITLGNAVAITGLPFLFVLVSGLIIVLVNSWQLGLYLAFIVAMTLWLAYIDSIRRNDMRLVRLEASKRVTAHLSDSIVNAQAIKAFAAETKEFTTAQGLTEKLRLLRISDWQRTGRNGNNRVALLLIALVLLLLITNRVSHGNSAVFSTGIFAFTYTFTLILRLFDLNALTRQVEESFLQAAPIASLLMEPIEITDTADAQPLKVEKGAIKFEHVRFQYEDGNTKQPVFGNLDLDIKPGEKVGLVGPSGGGKSTLVRLLMRFEDIQAGSICIDNQNISEVTQQSLRQAITYVPQEPLLFHRSIRENIAYGKPDADNKAIAAAAHKAYADEFIGTLPKGYDTVVGERGVKLSGGQRQRIAIARAILKNVPILILDEATSALDSESEKVIQEALWQLMEDKTAIVIAHRLSTIQKLDRIIVLDDGKIVEDGSHAQLVKNKGLYARLWQHQSGGFIEE